MEEMIMAKLTRKALIELLERGENLYVVCVSSAYIRDAQYYEPSLLIHDHESGSGEDDDIQNDDNGWIDYTPRDCQKMQLRLDTFGSLQCAGC